LKKIKLKNYYFDNQPAKKIKLKCSGEKNDFGGFRVDWWVIEHLSSQG
jgi:hypothetical protein